ncbi:hypothetical protein EV363DRAFT_1299211 [Boletus edulis]|nr:hypothetical protein EV363DRAFT_1299211 [Boletus edulis]
MCTPTEHLSFIPDRPPTHQTDTPTPPVAVLSLSRSKRDGGHAPYSNPRDQKSSPKWGWNNPIDANGRRAYLPSIRGPVFIVLCGQGSRQFGIFFWGMRGSHWLWDARVLVASVASEQLYMVRDIPRCHKNSQAKDPRMVLSSEFTTRLMRYICRVLLRNSPSQMTDVLDDVGWYINLAQQSCVRSGMALERFLKWKIGTRTDMLCVSSNFDHGYTFCSTMIIGVMAFGVAREIWPDLAGSNENLPATYMRSSPARGNHARGKFPREMAQRCRRPPSSLWSLVQSGHLRCTPDLSPVVVCDKRLGPFTSMIMIAHPFPRTRTWTRHLWCRTSAGTMDEDHVDGHQRLVYLFGREFPRMGHHWTDHRQYGQGRISFTRDQLDGVPEYVKSGYAQRTEGDKVLYEVTFRFPSRLTIDSPTTSDTWILLSVYVGRSQRYYTEVKMILDDLKAHLDPLGTQERATLLGLKEEVHSEHITDDSLVKEYFPVSVVVPAILDIYQNLFGVKFVEITGDARDMTNGRAEAQQFAVWEMDAKDESGFIGYCYLDLFPRALMRHDDVTTFFHGLLSRNFFFARYVNVELFYLRQLFFANFDLVVHNNSLDVNTDYTKLWNYLREKISLVQGSEYKPGQGTFGYIVGGYVAGYYGYTYSLVFAADMYVTDFWGREPDPKAFINEIEQDSDGDAAWASNL